MQDILHKTLIIRLSSVGDIVLSSPLIRILRRRFPVAQIDYLVKEEFAGLVRHNPHLSRVIEFPTGGTLGELVHLRRTLRQQQYDLVVDLHGSIRSRFLCRGLRRVVRVNKRVVARWLLIRTGWNIYSLFGGAPGVAQRYLETLRPFGATDDGEGLDLFLGEEELASAREALRTAGIAPTARLLGLCPSAKHGNKIWPKERFAEAAVMLARERHAAILLLGSGDEAGRCEEVCGLIRGADPSVHVVNLAGRSTLGEAGALLDRCELVLTNDSGLMHIAAARKRPLVAVFGPTVREFGFFPQGTRSEVVEHPSLHCRPCTHIGLPACPRGHFKCMLEIPAARVTEAAGRIAA